MSHFDLKSIYNECYINIYYGSRWAVSNKKSKDEMEGTDIPWIKYRFIVKLPKMCFSFADIKLF